MGLEAEIVQFVLANCLISLCARLSLACPELLLSMGLDASVEGSRQSLQTGQTGLGYPPTGLPGMTDRKTPSDYCTRNRKGRLVLFHRQAATEHRPIHCEAEETAVHTFPVYDLTQQLANAKENSPAGNFLEEGCFSCSFNLFWHVAFF